jgi:D-alanyl-D-alanine endopeptidase (penicillin-binding protein 7)
MNPTTLQMLVPAVGWALLHFVWQGLIVGAAAALLLALMRSAGPRWRYAVCGLALLASVGLPLLNLAFLLAPAGESSSPDGGLPDVWQDLQAQMPALVTAWSLGVAVMALRLALGLVWVRRTCRQAVSAPALWQQRLDALAARLGVRRQVPLKLHPALSGPVTLGFWRPVVLLPAALLTGMPAPMLEALLAHELAHVRRWDYLANLLQSLCEALLFFHPVVWWLSTRMRQERELVADELAAQALDDPRRLAVALRELSLAPNLLSQPPWILSARGGSLLERIERLMAPPPATASWKLALPALLLACTSMLVQARSQPAAPQPGPAAASAAPAPEVSAAALLKLPVNARHVLVLDDSTNKVLMAKDADAVVPIASLTKLMTAMVLLDAKLDPNEKLRITRDDVDTLKHSRSLLPVGSEMVRAAALRMALMASENRAAAALARTYPGGNGAFEQALQAKIKSLGLTHTTLSDPTGLSPANTSTATEVAKIAEAAARYPEIADITSDKKAQVAVNGRPRELHNTNRLVGGKGWDIRLSKTGYTEEAGRCLTMQVRMRMPGGEKNVTVVLLDADGSRQRLSDANKIRSSLAKMPPRAM